MAQPLRRALVLTALLVVVAAAFGAGRHLRQVTSRRATPPAQAIVETRVAGTSLGAAPPSQEAGDAAETFLQVQRYLLTEYVDRITDTRKLGQGAVRAMALSLDDPMTRFHDPEQRKELERQMAGRFSGIGATLRVVKEKRDGVDQRRVAVVAPVPGGPADKAGLRAGDVIEELDGKWIIAYDPRLDLNRLELRSLDNAAYLKALKEAQKKLTDGVTLTRALTVLTTGSGKALTLTVRRPGSSAPLKVGVTTAETVIPPVEARPIGTVTYVRVATFGGSAGQEFAAALKARPNTPVLLDLRDNAGGPYTDRRAGALGSAIAIGQALGAKGTMGAVVRRGGRREPIEVSSTAAPKRRVAVLVNGGTSNVAELVAQALREQLGARLVGSKTFGDGVAQKLVPLQGGSALVVNAGKLVTAGGAEFAGKGLQPDVAVTPGPDDPALRRGVALLARR